MQGLSSSDNLRFLVKLSTKNSYIRVNIFYFDELHLLVKVSKEIIESVKCLQISFYTKGYSDFFLFWFMSCTAFSVFG